MNISPVQYSSNYSFSRRQHFNNDASKGYSLKQKAIVASTSALGVSVALACLAKRSGYSLNPSRMFRNLKKSYFAQAVFERNEIISMGVGTCLGGLLGGYIIDKDPESRKAKIRESIMQIGNISIPITIVDAFAKLGYKIGAKKGPKTATYAKGAFSLGGLLAGVYLSNFLMNKLGNAIFHKNNSRGVKATDFSAHVDDMVVTAGYLSSGNKYIHDIGRIVPFALTIPGYEVGIKK